MARGKDKKTQPQGAADLTQAALCRIPEDLLRPEAATLIGQVVRLWLEQQRLGPYELLCRKDMATELSNSATVYNAAVRAAAALQAPVAGVDVPTRSRELDRLLQDHLHAHAVDPGRFFGVTRADLGVRYKAGIEADGLFAARHLLIASVCQHIEHAPSFGAKAERLLSLLEACDDDDVRRVFDEMLASYLLLDGARADMFIDETSPFALLSDFVGLIAGQALPRRGACTMVKRLTPLMAQLNMGHTRKALQWAFEHVVVETRSFASPAKLSDKDKLMWELVELSKLHKKMQACGGWFVEPVLVDAMNAQVARRTGSLQLDAFTADQHGIFAKTLELLKLYPVVYGERNVARIEALIYENMTRPDLPRLLDQCARSPMDQLGLYGMLEQKIRKADMRAGLTNEIVGNLARLQETFIRDRQVFHKFRHLRTGTSEKGLYVLELLILGAFTAGRCRAAAIKLMLLFLPSKQRLLEAITETRGVETDEDRSEELCTMYDYFVTSL